MSGNGAAYRGGRLPQIRPQAAAPGENYNLLLQYAQEVQEVRKRRFCLQNSVKEAKEQFKEAQKEVSRLHDQLLQEQTRFKPYTPPSYGLISSLTRYLLQYEHENQELYRKLQDIKQSKNYYYKENAENYLRYIVEDYTTELEREKSLGQRLSDLMFENYQLKRQKAAATEVTERAAVQLVSSYALSTSAEERQSASAGTHEYRCSPCAPGFYE